MRKAPGVSPGAAAVKPILKWAGGKRQLLPTLRRFYPPAFSRYFEPFVGSAAVFLDLHNSGRLDGREARLSDVNADVIGCYRMVRDAVDDVIAALQVLESGHHAGSHEHFYEVRDGRFNPRRRELHAAPSPEDRYTPDLAAMLIYLNRTGYNGLFRVNSRGQFNVPVGRHGAVRICDAENLRRLSAALGTPGVTLAVQLFEDALADANEGDFVYLDPPYAPVSQTAYFTSYTAGRFGLEQQIALQQLVIAIADRGARVLLSNSVAPDIRTLYEESAEVLNAGLRARTVEARRAINSRASGRGAVLEYLISNVDPSP
jgi:DNA adenine methylase